MLKEGRLARVRIAVVNCYACGEGRPCPVCRDGEGGNHGGQDVRFFPTFRLFASMTQFADFNAHTNVPYDSIPQSMLHWVEQMMPELERRANAEAQLAAQLTAGG